MNDIMFNILFNVLIVALLFLFNLGIVFTVFDNLIVKKNNDKKNNKKS